MRSLCQPSRTTPLLSPICVAVLGLLLQASLVTPSQAQTVDAGAAPSSDGTSALPGITVKAPRIKESKAAIGGLPQDDVPEWQMPQQAERFSEQAFKSAQVQRLGDLVKLDASTSASYNAAGYWDFLSVRGYVLDLTHNYRREGLPISGESSLPLDNKAGIEILKGTSGMQAGISSPGGLLNLLVKRPEGRIRTAEVAFTGHRSVLAAIDLSERFGADQAFGLRANVAHERLHTSVQHSRGQRHLLALAGDWRLSPGTLIEAEIEHSRRSQRSATGFSLLGTTVPLASSIHPNINLNNQPWVLPVEMRGTTGTLRVTQQLSEGWKLTGTYGQQRLQTDDRTAFPFGGLCNNDDGFINCDRFSPTGGFSVYDFRSENESRVMRAAEVRVDGGAIRIGDTTHKLAFGVLRTLAQVDVPTASFNQITTSTGNVSGNFAVAPAPLYNSAQILRDERSTEFHVNDNIRINEAWQAWAGLRHTRLTRAQTPSDLSSATSRAQQDLITPWLALGYQFMAQHQAYVSWGEGVELPNAKFNTPAVTYVNNGAVLPATKSRQWELGVKGLIGNHSHWSLNYFRTTRPEASTVQTGTDGGGFPLYSYLLDGDSRHQGVEGRLRTRIRDYTLDVSAMVMDAERRGSAKDGVNGNAPVNVPDYTLKMSHGWRVATLPGLHLQADIVHEGARTVDAPNDIRIPAWTRVDLGMHFTHQAGKAQAITWRLGVSNLFDTRAWVESPTQFDHIYLFPMAERTVTASMQLSF